VTLAAAFLASAAPLVAERAAARPDLEELLRRLIASARHDGVALADEMFAGYLGARTSVDDVDNGISGLHVADLWLACACGAASPGALAAFDRLLVGDAAQAVRLIDPAPTFVDEVLQTLRHKLLVSNGNDHPRLASYSGIGPLAAWLRVAATRAALSLKRASHPVVELEDALLLEYERGADSQLAHADAERRFRAALAHGLSALAPRLRNLLRLHHLDGLGVTELGRLYHVHASTISRWLQAARDEVLAGTREALLAEVSTAEAESILRHVGSMEITLERFLRSSR
jgi:RNA polymerase sigma-70 factor (ECF subfamily)